MNSNSGSKSFIGTRTFHITDPKKEMVPLKKSAFRTSHEIRPRLYRYIDIELIFSYFCLVT